MVIGDGAGLPQTTFGSEPFTPFNLLRYGTFQLQDSVTKFAKNHSMTFGGTVEKFHSDNSFYFGIQSAYSYNTLADFYADANGYLANPNRTVAPGNLLGFQVKYLLQPGQTTPPLQPLDVIYAGGYIQDEWRPQANLTVTAGIRIDVPKFGNTAFDNPVADNLTFRDQDGSPVKYNTGALPETTPYYSPRVGLNWDVNGDQATQVRGGSGLFSGKPPYVWISNQIGNTGVLFGFIDTRNTTAFRSTRTLTSTSRRRPAASRPATSSTSPTRASASRRRGAPTSASTAGCRGAWSARSTTSTTATSTRRSTSTPTCRRPRAPTRAWTIGRAGPPLRLAPHRCRASPSRFRPARRPGRSAPALSV